MHAPVTEGRTYLKPWIFGIAAGAVVVLAEAFGGLYPPAAYSFCLTCHTRDLVNSLVNSLFGTSFQTTLLAHRMLMVTSPSVLVGAFIGARLHGEYNKLRSGSPSRFFLFGFIVMTAGILIFGCPTRIAIRTGYGDLYGIAAFAGMLLGIFTATVALRWWWTGRR
jgi:hypothetical protein